MTDRRATIIEESLLFVGVVLLQWALCPNSVENDEDKILHSLKCQNLGGLCRLFDMLTDWGHKMTCDGKDTSVK